jgi:spermidine synthase
MLSSKVSGFTTETHMSKHLGDGFPRIALTLMLVFFVLSGISGLIYQAVWSQYLGLILGHAAYAQSLVLSTFMGGMALGAWIASRYLGRLGSLLRAYGLLEAAIGVFGIAFHAFFLLASGWLFDNWLPRFHSQGATDASRYALALLLILPQTVLLGMTFPVMSAGLIRWQPMSAGRVLGGLYFFNSIGAAVGALLATFVLIPGAGLPGAMTFAGVLNLLVAVFVLLLRVPPRAVQIEAHVSATAEGPAQSQALLRFVLLAAFVTGAASFMYEIGWVRMLSLALGSSLHTFELMLAAFIGGLAFGGLYIRKRLDGIAAPLRYFGWVQVLMGLAALATLPLYDHAFSAVGWVVGSLSRTEGGYTLYNWATAAVSMAIMVPAAFFAGMTLPLMTYALLRRGVGEKAIGLVYAANTIGAILGVMLMVHVLMPALGLKMSMVLAASIDIGLGLIVLRRFSEDFRPAPYFVAVAGSFIAVAIVMTAAPFDPRRLVSGVYRTGIAQLAESSNVSFLRDGKTASIAIYSQGDGSQVIATNGKPDAALMMDPDKPPTMDEPTMVMAGLLALSHHPQPGRIANIGFGSGLTTQTLASSSLPAEIVSVEIEPAIVAAARSFGTRVGLAYTDPRSRIVIDDARAYFSGGGQRFDVIVSEPSNPWVSGVAKLFSQEFYDFVPRHLNAGGLLVQWVQAYEMSDQTLLSILAALDSRFADYAIYTSNEFDLLIVASPESALPALSDAPFRDAALDELAHRVGIHSAAELRARLVANKQIVQAMIAVAQPIPNSDFFPTVAHLAPRDRFSNQNAAGVSTIYYAAGAAMTLLGTLPPPTAEIALNPAVLNTPIAVRRQGLAMLAAINGRPEGRILDELSPTDYASVAVLRQWGSQCFADADVARVIVIMSKLFRRSLARVSMVEAQQAWTSPQWVVCAEGQQPPADIAMALDAYSLALQEDAGDALLDRAGKLISGVQGLPSETLADLYVLSLVGAARAELPDEVLALHRATLKGLPMGDSQRLQMNTIAQLAFGRASRADAR